MATELRLQNTLGILNVKTRTTTKLQRSHAKSRAVLRQRYGGRQVRVQGSRAEVTAVSGSRFNDLKARWWCKCPVVVFALYNYTAKSLQQGDDRGSIAPPAMNSLVCGCLLLLSSCTPIRIAVLPSCLDGCYVLAACH